MRTAVSRAWVPRGGDVPQITRWCTEKVHNSFWHRLDCVTETMQYRKEHHGEYNRDHVLSELKLDQPWACVEWTSWHCICTQVIAGSSTATRVSPPSPRKAFIFCHSLPTTNWCYPDLAVALSLWSNTTLKINNKHQTKGSAHFVFFPVCEYSVLVLYIQQFLNFFTKK